MDTSSIGKKIFSLPNTTSRHRLLSATWLLGTLISCLPLSAQTIEGTSYTLPQAVMRFTVKTEKTTYTPGQLAQYARRYFKKEVEMAPKTTHRLIGISMVQTARPDTAKQFTLITDKKHSIGKVSLTDAGQLLAINTDALQTAEPDSKFTPAPKLKAVNPKDQMSQEILNAGSSAKMAELIAREIYDIRESRNMLNRGEADFMPKDGEQLRIMLSNLSTQEQALAQVFEGTTVCDTTWTTFYFTPTKEGRQVLFRLSKHLGLVDSDDLAGEPYYISIEDMHTVKIPEPAATPQKEDKNDIGLRVSQPGKIRATVTHDNQTIDTYELLAPQFGYVEALSGELFGKKQSSRITLDPLTGSVKTIEAITAE